MTKTRCMSYSYVLDTALNCLVPRRLCCFENFCAKDDRTGKISERCYARTAPLPQAASRFACCDINRVVSQEHSKRL